MQRASVAFVAVLIAAAAPATLALAGNDVTHTFTITNVGGEIVPACIQ